MPLNESATPQRVEISKQVKRLIEEGSIMPNVTNQFAVDANEVITDLSNPPRNRYQYNPYPRMLYAADGTWVIVQDQKQEAAQLKKGYTLKPPTPKAAEKEA